MGIYLNPGRYSYEEAVASEVYVDKSEMILQLNAVVRTKAKYVSVSRPRRFGKTMAADMLCAYYGRGANARRLFERRKLSNAAPVPRDGEPLGWDAYLGEFDVVRVVMTDFFSEDSGVGSALEYLAEEVMDELTAEYPNVRYGSRLNLRTVMGRIYADTGRQFVIVIDEWDAPFRVCKADAKGQRKYIDFLRDWLKDKDYIALAYMTGILPIKKYGRHSALNMFEEYSMTQPQRLAEYVGFTADEVRDVCEQRGLRFEGMREWYDGYLLSNKPSEGLVEDGSGEAQVFEVYNPYSVARAARSRRLGSYWSKTETYEALAEYIRMDYDGLKGAVALLMDGGRVPVDTSTYQNDMTTLGSRDDVLSLLVHLGYLGYDEEAREAFVPNREVMGEFRASTKTDEWALVFDEYEASKVLLEATWAADEERVANLVEQAHDHAGNKTYNDEAALSYAIQLAYFAARKYYTTVLELDSGKGYADVAFIPSPKRPDLPALIVELKYNRDAHTALGQVLKQRYPARLAHYRGNTLLVGINYDRDVRSDAEGFKHHTCRIERA